MAATENAIQEVQDVQPQEPQNFFSRMSTRVNEAIDNLKTEEFKSGISDQTKKVSDAYGQVKGRIGLRDFPKMAQALEAWLPTLATDDGLGEKLQTETEAMTGWLAQLPDTESVAFTKNLFEHCTTFDFDLEWLIDPEVSKIMDEPLRRDLTEIVLLYCLAANKAEQDQDGIAIFVKLQKWLEDPFSGEYDEFNHQLFTKLIAEDLVPAPPLELFLSSKEERTAYSVNAIQNLIAENNHLFYQFLGAELEVAAEESVANTDSDDRSPETEAAETS